MSGSKGGPKRRMIGMDRLVEFLERNAVDVERIDAETLGIVLPAGERLILQVEVLD